MRSVGRKLRGSVASLVFLAAGCSLMVPDSIDDLACAANGVVGPPACPDGQFCSNKVCKACHAADRCGDGIDDNCNGVIDDGCPTGGSAGDGGTSGSSTGGSAGTSGGTAGTGGTGGTVVVPQGLGHSCENDSGCATGTCLPWEQLNETMSGSICTRPCCSSGSCGGASGGAVCHPALSGAGMCVMGSDVGRPDVGVLPTGQPCTSHGDCRSGWCENDICNDVCCFDSGCSNAGGVCRKFTYDLGGVSSRVALVCGEAAGSALFQQPCSGDVDCRWNMCYQLDAAAAKSCAAPCCSSEDCGPPGLTATSCKYVTGPLEAGAVRACASTVEVPMGVLLKSVGELCMIDDECRSNRCIIETDGAPGYCSDTCCSDSDCELGGESLKCLPVFSVDQYVLRCKKVP